MAEGNDIILEAGSGIAFRALYCSGKITRLLHLEEIVKIVARFPPPSIYRWGGGGTGSA